MKFQKLMLIAGALISFSGAAFADPKLLWELGGLKDPESAVVDREKGVIYVTNANGPPATKDGNGSIAKVGLDGKPIDLNWASGLDSPLGLAKFNDKLYAADVDQLVEVDVNSGKITKRYPAAGAKFLNDVTAGPDGKIYVSDMLTDTIWRLDGDKFEAWLQSPDLKAPNGLRVHDGKIFVASWGKIDGDGFATSVPGHVLEVSLNDKSIKSVGSNAPLGNLDGIEPTGDGHFLLTDWVAGGLFKFDPATGKAVKLLPLAQGTADIGYDQPNKLVVIPMMKDHKLLAYTLD